MQICRLVIRIIAMQAKLNKLSHLLKQLAASWIEELPVSLQGFNYCLDVVYLTITFVLHFHEDSLKGFNKKFA